MPEQTDLSKVAESVCTRLNASLGAELGAGAYKRTYLVQHGTELYALKISTISSDLIERYKREAEALQGCNHSSIAKLLSSFTFKVGTNDYWICLEEYLPHGTLAARMSVEGPSAPLAKLIATTMAGALGHLRERRFIHRDIKPANIVFRSHDDPVLTDFGIVRMLDALTLTAEFMPQGPGTPLYAAPEQLLNDIQLIDWRTDQFGLALVASECAIGFHPFATDGDLQLAVSRVARRESIPTETEKLLIAAGFECLIKALSP